MAENTLEKIIEKKINKINNLKKNITIESLNKRITENNSSIQLPRINFRVLNSYID